MTETLLCGHTAGALVCDLPPDHSGSHLHASANFFQSLHAAGLIGGAHLQPGQEQEARDAEGYREMADEYRAVADDLAPQRRQP